MFYTIHYSHLLESCALGLKETMLKIQCLPLRNLGSIEGANNQGPVHTALVEKGAGHTDRHRLLDSGLEDRPEKGSREDLWRNGSGLGQMKKPSRGKGR